MKEFFRPPWKKEVFFFALQGDNSQKRYNFPRKYAIITKILPLQSVQIKGEQQMGLFDKLFGTRSQREIKRIQPLVDKVLSL